MCRVPKPLAKKVFPYLYWNEQSTCMTNIFSNEFITMNHSIINLPTNYDNGEFINKIEGRDFLNPKKSQNKANTITPDSLIFVQAKLNHNECILQVNFRWPVYLTVATYCKGNDPFIVTIVPVWITCDGISTLIPAEHRVVLHVSVKGG